MASVLDPAALDKIFKIQYTEKSKLAKFGYPDNPLWALLKKTKFVGKRMEVQCRSNVGQSRSVSLAKALTNMHANEYLAFQVPRQHDYAVFEVSGEAIDASANDEGSVLKALTEAIDGGFISANRAIANDLYQAGGGARGQIKAGTAINTPVIQLAKRSQAVNFFKGQVLKTATTDGTSGSQKAGSVTVTAVDRNAGTVTVSGNWNAGIGTVAAGDYIFQDGDFDAVRSKLYGLSAWCPRVAPTTGDNFCGEDRSDDPTWKAGSRYTLGAGGPIEETLVDAGAELLTNGGRATHVFMHPLDHANLVKQLGAKVQYDRATSLDMPEIGFEAVKVTTAGGTWKVVQDLNCPQGDAWAINLEDWEFAAAGAAPKVLDHDGQKIRAAGTTDTYIGRIGYYGNLLCRNTQNNIYIAL